MVCDLSVLDGFPQPRIEVLRRARRLQPATRVHPAQAMMPPQRRQLALEALAGTETVSRLAGQALAMPEVPCRGDVFHALQSVQSVATFLENRAYVAIGTTANLRRKKTRLDWQGRRVPGVAVKLGHASSLVENLNSRLRNYFFLRRHLGPDYRALLQFFLNHRRFVRSEWPERAGKSPAELLSGSPHPHWLEMLDYARFSRN